MGDGNQALRVLVARWRPIKHLDGGRIDETHRLAPARHGIPIRFYEARAFSGHPGSFANTLTGFSVRLDDDKKDNLEDGFPTSCPLAASGESMKATIYAFKKDRAKTYRNDEGIIFTLNGQTHGCLTPDFFRRKSVGLSYLSDSLLVVVDCSGFTGRAREDLFMNSRDRLSKGELRSSIESELEDMLKNHQGLRDLKERRRREETESRLADSKPLEDVLRNDSQALTKSGKSISARQASVESVQDEESGERTAILREAIPHLLQIQWQGLWVCA